MCDAASNSPMIILVQEFGASMGQILHFFNRLPYNTGTTVHKYDLLRIDLYARTASGLRLIHVTKNYAINSKRINKWPGNLLTN